MDSNSGVSEIVGAILLVSLVIIGVMIVSVAVLSQPPPEEIPQVTALAENISKTVYLYHNGGDSLQPNEIRVLVNGENSSFSLINSEQWPWSAGKTLKIDYTGSGMPEYVQLIYTGGSTQTLILTAYFVPPVITGGPTSFPTTGPTTAPTTIPTTAPTTSPTATGDSTPTTTVTTTVTTTATTSPTPTPTPGCGTISGMKWNDLNGNGQKDTGEPGLSGWIIQIYEKLGDDWIFVTSTTTGSGGMYIASGLQYHPANQYLVKEIVQPGWQRTFPPNEDYYNFIVLNLPHCYETGIDFGNLQVAPPVADFLGSPTSGYAPLTVQFTDQSTGNPTQWAWDFNNDGSTDSTAQNPTYVYPASGTYSVKLTVTNAGGSNTKIRTGYITVNPPILVSVYLNANKEGLLQTGNYIQFRITDQYSYIKHGNTQYNLNLNDIVKLELTNDLKGSIYATSSYISDFRFNDIKLYINGIDKGTKDIGNGDIWISGYDSYVSTMKLVVASQNEWTFFQINNPPPLIYGQDNSQIQIFNLQPSQYNIMNLDNRNDVYYNGGATSYSIT